MTPARLGAVRWTDLWALAMMGLTALLAWHQIIVVQHPFSLDDWLISYADGPVRRGLSGTLLQGLAALTGLAPHWLVLALVSGLSAALIALTAALARPVAGHLAAWPLLLSPATFLFPGFDPDGALRKEVLVFALLAACLWRSRQGKDTAAIAVFSLCTPPILLMHEGMAPFLLYGLVLLPHRPTPNQITWIATGAAGLLATLAFVRMFPGDQGDVKAICAALSTWRELVRAQECPGIGAIGWLAREGASSPLSGPEAGAMLGWTAQAAAAAALGMIPAAWVVTRAKAGRRLALPALLAVATSVPLFLLAEDWGRFIHIHATCLSLCLLASLPTTAPTYRRRTAFVAAALVLLYASSWHLHHFNRAFIPGPGYVHWPSFLP